MGLLRGRKPPGAASLADLVASRMRSLSATGSPATGVTILNPTSDAELERVLASIGPARGVVIRSRHEMADGERPVRTRVHITVRPRLGTGMLGDEAELTTYVGWKAATLLEPGLEIPIQLNRATGRIDAIATDHLARELAPRDDEAKRRRPLACAFLPPTGPPHAGPDR